MPEVRGGGSKAALRTAEQAAESTCDVRQDGQDVTHHRPAELGAYVGDMRHWRWAEAPVK